MFDESCFSQAAPVLRAVNHLSCLLTISELHVNLFICLYYTDNNDIYSFYK